MTTAVVYRNGMGPAAIWLLTDEESPPSYTLPDNQDPRPSLFDYKGPEMSWEDWGQHLAGTPQVGDWSVEDVPDGLSPQQAMAAVRSQDTLDASLGS
jgi:hypothetical protein